MPVFSHLTLVGWSSPLDYHCSFPFFPQDWWKGGGGLTSVTSRTARAPPGKGTPASCWRDRIWFSGIGMLSPWRKHHLGCWLRCLCFHLCLLQRRMKRLFCLLHGGQETRRACWSKQNADACGVGKRDVDRRGASRWRDGGGDNKLFANQATMSAIALLDWMQQAWLFQPDYWSMWTHIFPAMGEEAVMTKPMPLPLLLSLTVPSCSSSTSLSHSVLISCLICARSLFFFFFPPALSLSVSLYITQGDIIFPSFRMEWKASGWCAVKACCQKLWTFATFQGKS